MGQREVIREIYEGPGRKEGKSSRNSRRGGGEFWEERGKEINQDRQKRKEVTRRTRRKKECRRRKKERMKERKKKERKERSRRKKRRKPKNGTGEKKKGIIFNGNRTLKRIK